MAELKFNCFFLLPLVDAFPPSLRRVLEGAYEAEPDAVFDVAALRAALTGRQAALEAELKQVPMALAPTQPNPTRALHWLCCAKLCCVACRLCGPHASRIRPDAIPSHAIPW